MSRRIQRGFHQKLSRQRRRRLKIEKRLIRTALMSAAVLWALALPVAAYTAGRSNPAVSPSNVLALMVYELGSLICHQRPERSFHLGLAALPVCARCTGLYAAAPLACLVALLAPSGRARRLWDWAVTPRGLLLAALPTIVTVIVERTTGWTSAPVRALAGAGLGFGGAGLVCGALAHAAGRDRNAVRL
jgi:hypothetical protein